MPWLKAIRGMDCVRCGAPDAVPAHYSGRYAHQLGKGMGRKAWDHCVAALCHRCHTEMDTYAAGNDDARAAEFLLLVLRTQHRLLTEGRVRATLGRGR